MSVVSFAESAAAGSSSQALGPVTLRKSSAAVSSSIMSEIAKNLLPNTNSGNNGSGIPFILNGDAGHDHATNGVGNNSSFAPNRPDILPRHDKLLMTAEDLKEAEARTESARQQAEMDAIASNPALQIKNLINTKLTMVSQGIAENSAATTVNMQKSLDAMKGSAASVVSGMKQGLQKDISFGSGEMPQGQPMNPFAAAKTTFSPNRQVSTNHIDDSSVMRTASAVDSNLSAANTHNTATKQIQAPGNPFATTSSSASPSSAIPPKVSVAPPSVPVTSSGGTATIKGKANEVFGRMSSMFKRS